MNKLWSYFEEPDPTQWDCAPKKPNNWKIEKPKTKKPFKTCNSLRHFPLDFRVNSKATV